MRGDKTCIYLLFLDVIILLEGIANIHWTDDVVKNKNGFAVPVIKDFCGSRLLLCKSYQCQNHETISGIGSEQNFQFQLPKDLLPTCEVKHAQVKYELSVFYLQKDVKVPHKFFSVPIIIRKFIAWPIQYNVSLLR